MKRVPGRRHRSAGRCESCAFAPENTAYRISKVASHIHCGGPGTGRAIDGWRGWMVSAGRAKVKPFGHWLGTRMPNDAFQAIDRRRLAEHAADQIEHPIIEGRLEPGQKLPPERELSEKLCGRPASSTSRSSSAERRSPRSSPRRSALTVMRRTPPPSTWSIDACTSPVVPRGTRRPWSPRDDYGTCRNGKDATKAAAIAAR